MTDRAIIYVPDTSDRARWERLATEYCERHGYQVAGLVVGRAGHDHWFDAVALITAGQADLIVVGRRDQLPIDRRPRVEVVTEAEVPPGSAGLRPRRPGR